MDAWEPPMADEDVNSEEHLSAASPHNSGVRRTKTHKPQKNPPPAPPPEGDSRLRMPRTTRDPELWKATGGACSTRLDPLGPVTTDLEEIYGRWDALISPEEWPVYREMALYLAEAKITNQKELSKATNVLRTRYKMMPKKSQLLHAYNALVSAGELQLDEAVRGVLMKKASKSLSGVLVITVLTSPWPELPNGKKQKFSCQWNCYYCPNEPGQPRSYLHDEPAVMRANQNGFDPVLQFHDRAATLACNGHPIDKIEILVLGGTWSSYPEAYRETFVRDLFFSANTFYERKKRPRRSLLEEKLENETAQCKIIGVTLETRPDTIDFHELQLLRSYGCTRVQLGLQHTEDHVLKKVNRGCTNADAMRAIELLKNAGFKVDIHLMPVLPGSSAEDDGRMFDRVLTDPNLQADQWKIYPTQTTPWTVIAKWHKEGSYVPYDPKALMDVLCAAKAKVHPWIRLNRVVRDIPSQYFLGGPVEKSNMREEVADELRRRGSRCRCIRCREIMAADGKAAAAEPVHRVYDSSGGVEHFLSFETPDRDTIIGFLRLRLKRGNTAAHVFPELRDAALIRELHVYGKLVPTDPNVARNGGIGGASQSVGAGTRLMGKAEAIATYAGFKRVAVIAGVGTRQYYYRLGYSRHPGDGQYMIKTLPPWWLWWYMQKETRRTRVLLAAVCVVLCVVHALTLWRNVALGRRAQLFEAQALAAAQERIEDALLGRSVEHVL